MFTAAPPSYVLEHEPSHPQIAALHFESRLSVETDPSDVYHDLQAGVEGLTIIDARSLEAYEQAHVSGAISFPYRSINEETVSSLKKDGIIVVYCWGPGCNAGCKAGVRLANLGYRVKEMIGGFEYWVKEGYPVEGIHADDPPIYNPKPS